MSVISVSLPADGETIDAADYNTPINTIVNEINGNLDNSNIKTGAAISTSKLADDAGIGSAKLGSNSVTAAKADNGFVVQMASVSYSSVSTGTTTIPYDDTTPQNTEGDQVMTLSITPKASTNILVIEVIVQMASSVADNLTIALFRDSTASALAAAGQNNIATANAQFTMPLTHRMVAGGTSNIDFKVRIGGSQAGTRTFNGTGGARRYGGVGTMSSIVITEYKAA